MQHIDVDGATIEYQWIPPRGGALPTLVLLHEGLGCAAMWRKWAERLAEATGCGLLSYSRPGYGGSAGSLAGRSVDYLDRAADRCLPAVLAALELDNVVLFGHSDGATIALLFAANPTVTTPGLVLEAPHVFVEDITLAGIRQAGAAYRDSNIRERLARYHGERIDEVFHAWHDVWLSDDFRGWNIEDRLPDVAMPILLIQGDHDQYGTRAQLESIEQRTAGPVDTRLLPDCGHVPHRDQPDQVLALTRDFIHSLAGGPSSYAR